MTRRTHFRACRKLRQPHGHVIPAGTPSSGNAGTTARTFPTPLGDPTAGVALGGRPAADNEHGATSAAAGGSGRAMRAHVSPFRVHEVAIFVLTLRPLHKTAAGHVNGPGAGESDRPTRSSTRNLHHSHAPTVGNAPSSVDPLAVSSSGGVAGTTHKPSAVAAAAGGTTRAPPPRVAPAAAPQSSRDDPLRSLMNGGDDVDAAPALPGSVAESVSPDVRYRKSPSPAPAPALGPDANADGDGDEDDGGASGRGSDGGSAEAADDGSDRGSDGERDSGGASAAPTRIAASPAPSQAASAVSAAAAAEPNAFTPHGSKSDDGDRSMGSRGSRGSLRTRERRAFALLRRAIDDSKGSGHLVLPGLVPLWWSGVGLAALSVAIALVAYFSVSGVFVQYDTNLRFGVLAKDMLRYSSDALFVCLERMNLNDGYVTQGYTPQYEQDQTAALAYTADAMAASLQTMLAIVKGTSQEAFFLDPTTTKYIDPTTSTQFVPMEVPERKVWRPAGWVGR